MRSTRARVLSPRETQVLRLAARGAPVRAIATALDVSPNTVKTHLRRAAEKLGAVSREETLRRAATAGLVMMDAPPPVAAAPDGARAFVLLRAAGGRTALVPLDAATGAAGPAVLLPGVALGGLVVTAERVYVPDALGHGVWVVDDRRGRLLGTVPAGRGPLAITLSPSP